MDANEMVRVVSRAGIDAGDRMAAHFRAAFEGCQPVRVHLWHPGMDLRTRPPGMWINQVHDYCYGGEE
jgi:hypothetical protein